MGWVPWLPREPTSRSQAATARQTTTIAAATATRALAEVRLMVLPSARPPPSPSKHDPSCPTPMSRSPDQPRGHRVNVLVIGRAPNAARRASAMGILRRCGQETLEGCGPTRRSGRDRSASTTTPPGYRGRHSVCDWDDAFVEVEVVIAPGLQPAQWFRFSRTLYWPLRSCPPPTGLQDRAALAGSGDQIPQSTIERSVSSARARC